MSDGRMTRRDLGRAAGTAIMSPAMPQTQPAADTPAAAQATRAYRGRALRTERGEIPGTKWSAATTTRGR
jgi:hypothetical protein